MRFFPFIPILLTWLAASGPALAKSAGSRVPIGACLGRIMETVRGSVPTYLRLLEKGSLSVDEARAHLPLVKEHLDRLGVQTQWIRREGQVAGLEILPTGKSLYNKYARSVRMKLGVDRVVFEPAELIERLGAFRTEENGDRVIQVSSRSILHGRPDQTVVHETRHARFAHEQVAAPGSPWVAQARSLGRPLPPAGIEKYGRFQSFEEVVTHEGDLNAILKQLDREGRGGPAAQQHFKDTAHSALDKARLLADVCRRVVAVNGEIAPVFAQIQRAIRSGAAPGPLEPFLYRVEGRMAPLQVELKIEPAGRYPNGRERPERWVFKVSEAYTSRATRPDPATGRPVPFQAVHSTTPQYEISLPGVLPPGAQLSARVDAVQASLASAARLATEKQARAEKIVDLLDERTFSSPASIRRTSRDLAPLSGRQPRKPTSPAGAASKE